MIPRGFFKKKLYMDVPAGLWNFNFRYTYFCPHLPPMNIPIWYKIENNFVQIYVNSMPSSVMKTLQIGILPFAKKHPQKACAYTYIMSMWEPPFRVVTARFKYYFKKTTHNKKIIPTTVKVEIFALH